MYLIMWVGGGFPQGRVVYLNIFLHNTHFLASRLVTKNFKEISSKLPEISSFLKYEKWAARRKGKYIYTFFYLLIIPHLRVISNNFKDICS